MVVENFLLSATHASSLFLSYYAFELRLIISIQPPTSLLLFLLLFTFLLHKSPPFEFPPLLLFLGALEEAMCPLRFILVFFSALLAGYFAWRTVRSSPDTHVASDESALEDKSSTKNDSNLKEAIQNGFWVFVDMASGRYLWRNLRAVNRDEEQKSS